MSLAAKQVEVADGLAAMRESLADGSALANEIGDRFQADALWVIGAAADAEPFAAATMHRGRGISAAEADAELERLLTRVIDGPSVLMVEDNLARREDPGAETAVYCDDGVLRWRPLDEGREPVPVSDLLRQPSAGYPLNVYVIPRLAVGELSPATELSRSRIGAMAAHTYIVIVGIWDGESFLVALGKRR